MFKKFVFLLLVSYCGVAVATGETIPNVTITRINVYQDYAVLYFSPEFTHAQADCLVSKSRVILRFEEAALARKEMYSATLAAAMAGKKVNIGIADCVSSHPAVYRIDVTF